jgi:ABC-type lipoprotein release transport system permease subunit
LPESGSSQGFNDSAGSLTIGVAVLAILLLSVIASLVPALRAAHADSIRTLRVDG